MKTEKIEVPHFAGYRCLGYRVPKCGMYYYLAGLNALESVNSDHESEWLVYEKLQPKRYIFEETGERRTVEAGDLYINGTHEIRVWTSNLESAAEYNVLRRVEE